MASEQSLSQRMAFVGLIAWLSLCLLAAGLGPPLGPTLSKMWAIVGLTGLVSSVGLAVAIRGESQKHRELLASYMAEARTDPLTGLANRRALDQELGRRLSQWRRQDMPLSLLLVDVDRFKQFNDVHGHQAGDEALRIVADGLTATLRDMDLVCRYGGEEFAVVLPGTTLSDAQIAAERVREAVAKSVVSFRGKQLRISVSSGTAQAQGDEDGNDLVRRADAALYAAKQGGRNCCFVHDGETCARIRTSPEEQHAKDAEDDCVPALS